MFYSQRTLDEKLSLQKCVVKKAEQVILEFCTYIDIRHGCSQNVNLAEENGWMNGVFRPLFCTIKTELGRGQPGLMR